MADRLDVQRLDRPPVAEPHLSLGGRQHQPALATAHIARHGVDALAEMVDERMAAREGCEAGTRLGAKAKDEAVSSESSMLAWTGRAASEMRRRRW